MKILIFADLQSHNYREFSTIEDGVNTRLLDCTYTAKRIRLSADKNEVDMIWFVGDLYQLKNNLDSQVIQLTMYEMRDLAESYPLLLIPGHHDYRMWTHDPVMMKILSELSNQILIVDEPMWIDKESWFSDVGIHEENLQIYAEPCSRAIKDLNARIEGLEPRENSIFLGHQDVKGVSYRGFTVEHGLDADVLSKKFTWSFIGHWHAPKRLRKNVISVGAPLQHTFNDVGGKRGWWILDTKKNSLKFIENGFSPKFIDLEVKESDDLQKALEESATNANLTPIARVPGDPHKDFYRIKVKGAKLPKGLDYIKWKRVTYETEAASKIRSELKFSDSDEALVRKYVDMRAGNLNKKKLIEIGMKYL